MVTGMQLLEASATADPTSAAIAANRGGRVQHRYMIEPSLDSITSPRGSHEASRTEIWNMAPDLEHTRS